VTAEGAGRLFTGTIRGLQAPGFDALISKLGTDATKSRHHVLHVL